MFFLYYLKSVPVTLIDILGINATILIGIMEYVLFKDSIVRWQTDKKQEILKLSCKDLFIWTELLIVWLITWFDNIFNIEINGALSIHIIVHNSE